MKFGHLKSPILVLATLIIVTGIVVAISDSSRSDADGGSGDGIVTGSLSQNASGSGECGDSLTWTLTDGGSLSIEGTGAMTSWSGPTEAPWFQIAGASDILSISIAEGVTTVGAYAFTGTENVTSITVPNTVTSIGASAFEDSGLTSLTFSGTAMTLGESAFEGCSALENVTMPASLKYGTGAFDGCTKVKTVTITGSGNMQNYTDGGSTNPYTSSPWYVGRANSPTITIQDGVTSIGQYAFAGCTFLTSVPMADSVKVIEARAFKDCTGITEFTVLKSLNIAAYAFDGCTSITTLNIPSGSYVRYVSFNGCDSIGTINFTGSGDMADLTEISSGNAVWNNISGVTINISDQITSIGNYFFCGGDIGSIVIPLSITSLGTGAFNGCASLKSLTIPATINASGMFSGCTNLESVEFTGSGSTLSYDSDTYRYTPWFLSRNSLTKITLSGEITEIGAYMFRGSHPKLTLTVDEQILRIGDYAFGDNKFSSVTIPAGTEYISQTAFDGCAALKSFDVSDTNADYSSVDGLLCNKAGTDLILCPPGISGTFTVPDSIEVLKTLSVHGCSSMVGFSIGSNTKLEDNAVSGCPALVELYIPADRVLLSPGFVCDTLKTVRVTGSGAMTGYSPDPTDDDYYQNTPWYQSRASLTSVYTSESITSIGEYAFEGCSYLKHLTIPGSLGLAAGTFDNCRELSEVEFVGSGDMFDYSSDESSEYFYKVAPWNVTRASSLTVLLSETATSIGDNTFRGAYVMGSISIPKSVTSIGDAAFYGCSGLTELYFPSSVTSIGDEAFYGCWSVHKMVFEGRIPSDVGDDCFKFCYIDDSERCVVISEDDDDRLPSGSVDSEVMEYYTPASYKKHLDDIERIADLKDKLKIAVVVVPVTLLILAAIGITISERRAI